MQATPMAATVSEDDYLDGQGPDPEQQAQQARDELLSRLDAFGQTLAASRSEAIAGRESCGIEAEWSGDEEFYDGIDDANRSDSTSRGTKPSVSGGSSNQSASSTTGSTVFPNITRPYCDAASSRISDMLQPTDDTAWKVENTPIPDLVQIADGKFPAHVERQIAAQATDQQGLEAQKAQLAQAVKAQIALARDKAGKAQTQIEDWHVECQYHAHVRKVIEDAARMGTGVLKGPIPAKRKVAAFVGGQLVIKEEIKPVSMRVDPWNCYPDPACGEDIHSGSYFWERDDITRRKLEDLKGTPGYITEQIDKCLTEGPFEACKLATSNDTGITKRSTNNLFEIWYYHGGASKKDYLASLQLARKPEDESIDEESVPETVYVQCTMVNNRMIRCVQSHLDTGEFPYDYMVLQARKDLPYGVGVARQMRTAQRIVTAGWRNMMDNAGRAAGPQVLVNDEYVRPEDGIYEFVPFKVWRLVKALDGQMRMDDVFRFVKVDMMQEELAAIIEMGLRLAEDATGLPMIMQGQTNAATPNTLGGMQMQNNNASTVLRRVARLFDDRVTEPHVRRYYTYLMQYGDDDCKGDFVINAKGSSALVERDAQAPILLNLMQLFKDPIYKKDPAKAADEFLKSQRFDAGRFDFDDDKWQKIVANLGQPPPDSSVQVAQIREQGATQRNHDTLASKENIEAFRSDRQANLQDNEHQFLQLMAQYDQDVTAYEEGMANNRNTDSLKTKLADTTLKLRAQMQSQRQLMVPPTEPAGRAPNGQAFQR